MLDLLEKEMTKQALRYHVSCKMFCEVCQTILDVSDAVETTFRRDDTGKPAYMLLTCPKCFDGLISGNLENAKASAMEKAGVSVSVEIVDGRKL